MRRVAFVAFFGIAAFSSSAEAMCLSHAVQAYPRSDLPENGRIVIEGMQGSDAWVRAMDKPELVDESDHIPLKVVATHRGHQFAQVVLVPERAPKKGGLYSFSAKNVADEDRQAVKRFAWTIGARDMAPPVWDASPSLEKIVHKRFGCGPFIAAQLAVAVHDDIAKSGLFVVDVRRKDKPALSFIVAQDDGALSVGRGMCSGPWHPEVGVAYEIEVAAIDDAGNRALPAVNVFKAVFTAAR